MYVATLKNLPDAIIETAKSKSVLRRRCVQIHKLNLDAFQIEEVPDASNVRSK